MGENDAFRRTTRRRSQRTPTVQLGPDHAHAVIANACSTKRVLARSAIGRALSLGGSFSQRMIKRL